MKTKTLTLCAIFAAILCVCSVVTIPIGPVPITLGLFGIMLTAVILGAKKGAISVLVFILLGAVGLPVFSGFKGGVGVLLGPTGGYIWSYIIVALFIGRFAAKEYDNKWFAILRIFVVCLIGIVICYALGTVQFMIVRKMDFVKSLSLCVIPFIPFDICKAAVSAYVGYTVRAALLKARLLEQKDNNKVTA